MKRFSIRSEDGRYVRLSSPLKVYYDITTKCNLKCIFCFKDKSADIEKDDVTLEQARKIIKKVADANIPDIVFIGGEPMCCDFLFEALSYAKEMGLNPGFITNGTLFTPDNVKLIKKMVDNSVSVSIHAHNNEMHDMISNGVNTHSKIVNGLKLLNDVDITPEIAFTPTKLNMNCLYETIDGLLTQGIRVSDVLVNRLIPYGEALKCYSEKSICLEEQNKLFEQMERLQQKYPELKITSGDAIPFCMVEEKYRKFISRCDYAITLGWINDKNLFGKCMVRGSDSKESLDNNDLKSIWSSSDVFLNYRCMKNLQDVCKNCEWLLECGGGCSCSGMNGEVKDSYFDTNRMFSMPHNDKRYENEIIVTDSEIDAINDESTYILKYEIFMRREFSDNTFNKYLVLPASKGAVIQDIIESNNGTILWANELEYAVIHQIQEKKIISEMVKHVSYECGLNADQAKLLVKKTIATLIKTGMVEKYERSKI